jgi:hypothetical protein
VLGVGFHQFTISLGLLCKLLIIGRPKNGNVANWIDEQALSPDIWLRPERGKNVLEGPFVEIGSGRARREKR